MRFPALLSALALAAAIGCAGDADNADTATAGADTAAMAPDTAGMATAPTTATADARLDPNTATRDELIAIQGMTPAAADALIAGRPHQDMRSVARALASLPEAVRDSVYTRVWKRLDLNAASVAEIVYGPPATVSPVVRLYVAVTPSAARKPTRLPVSAGSLAPYSLLAAAGVTDAPFGLMVKLAGV